MVLAAGGTVWAGSADDLAGSEEGVEVEAGLAVGDHADGLGFADLEGVGVTQRLQLCGLLTDQVVNTVRSRVSPVMSRWLVPAHFSVVAVVGGAFPGCLALLVAGLQQVRVIAGDGLGDRGLDRPPPTRPDPVRQLGVHRRGTGLDRRWVAWAILRAFHGATLNASTAAQRRGSRWVEVQGVGQQLQPGQGGDPERGGERFGSERRHQRRPFTTKGFVLVASRPGRPLSDQVTNPDSSVAGWSTHQWAAKPQTRPGAPPSSTQSCGLWAKAGSHSASRSQTWMEHPSRRFRSCVQANQTPPTVCPGIGA